MPLDDRVRAVVRLAKREDLSDCVQLAQERDKAMGKKRKVNFWKNLFAQKIKKEKLLVGTWDNVHVGFCYFSGFLGEDHVNPYIELVWIHPAYRRKGIAKALYAKIEQITRRKGAEEIFSSCGYTNAASLRMHKRMGFEKCGLIKLGKNDKEIFFSKKMAMHSRS